MEKQHRFRRPPSTRNAWHQSTGSTGSIVPFDHSSTTGLLPPNRRAPSAHQSAAARRSTHERGDAREGGDSAARFLPPTSFRPLPSGRPAPPAALRKERVDGGDRSHGRGGHPPDGRPEAPVPLVWAVGRRRTRRRAASRRLGAAFWALPLHSPPNGMGGRSPRTRPFAHSSARRLLREDGRRSWAEKAALCSLLLAGSPTPQGGRRPLAAFDPRGRRAAPAIDRSVRGSGRQQTPAFCWVFGTHSRSEAARLNGVWLCTSIDGNELMNDSSFIDRFIRLLVRIPVVRVVRPLMSISPECIHFL
jgi:hypothetical protein